MPAAAPVAITIAPVGSSNSMPVVPLVRSRPTDTNWPAARGTEYTSVELPGATGVVPDWNTFSV